LVDREMGIAKAMNDNKAMQRQLEEQKHYNRVESRQVYFALYKSGRGISRKKNVNITLKISKDVITNIQLQQWHNRMHIPYFKGVFVLRITLLIKEIYQNENGIVNL